MSKLSEIQTSMATLFRIEPRTIESKRRPLLKRQHVATLWWRTAAFYFG
ncbi:MAG: hypothetical protein NVS4B7_18090 [Ktedonobacteraceae bacterium]